MSFMSLQRRGGRPTGTPDQPLPGPMPFAPAVNLLSEREHQIARLVTLGLSNKEIALELEISPWTVSAHLRRVFTKLDIGRRIELCAIMRAG